MLIQRADVTYSLPGLPNIFPYPQRVNTVGWWSADQNVQLSAGNVVTAWTDRTANAEKVVAGSSPYPIILTPNGQNGLPGIATAQTAAANNAWLRSQGPLSALDQMDWNVPWAVCLALKIGAYTGTEANHNLLSYAPPNAMLPGWTFVSRNTSMTIWNFTIYQVAGNLNLTLQSSSGVLQPGQTGTVIWTYDGSGVGPGIALYVNGIKLGVGAAGYTLVSTLYNAGRLLNLFNFSNLNSPDMLFELALCVGSFQQAQVSAMDQYLNQKWALHY
jgi:hypothetical protein